MFSRCTTCNTWFRLSRGAIRAAHGEVRCGACGARFNALATLHDRLPDDAFEKVQPNNRAPAAPPPEAPAAPWQPEADASVATASAEPTTDPGLATDNPGPADTPAHPKTDTVPAGETTGDIHVNSPSDARSSATQSADTTADDSPEAPAHGKARLRIPASAWWAAGCIILLVVLAGAAIIYKRNEPGNNAAVPTAATAPHNAVSKEPPAGHDVSALTISNAEVTALKTRGLIVTATLTNKAEFAQPWPKLRVVLTNRFGGEVARGLYGPDKYLRKGTQDRRLPAGATQKVRLEIADPGEQAVGFNIVPCLGGRDGLVCRGG